ncbi:GtrA family protein [Streptomyces sp. NPDC060000]|uniref:GtrA family protein n=1 Tax=Streptomyces sp. NPDC060000 TaxID=3347031 RepID=UPI0036A1E00D
MKSLTSFARFVAFGGGTGVLSSLAVPLLAVLMPWTVSNALITLASTVLCTELHARHTFRTGRHAGWRRHWQSAGSAAAAYAATSVAVFALHAVQAAPSMLTEQLVYLSASGLAGIGRFMILRLFVFATADDHETPKTHKTAEPAGTPGAIKAAEPARMPSAIKPAKAPTVSRPTASRSTISRPRRTPAPATTLTAVLIPG